MPSVFVSIGSNIDPERHVCSCLQALRERFGVLRLSTVYRTAAVGFDGDDFLNLVAAFDTEDTVDEVFDALHRIEDAHGRERSQQRFKARTLDLDLLLYGELVTRNDRYQLPRAEITRCAFVLKPLAEIAADVVHPNQGTTIDALWRAFDASAEQLQAVELRCSQ